MACGGCAARRDWIKKWSAVAYRYDFCSRCGSTVPNALRETPYYWIPLGLLDGELGVECIGDFCTDDAMPWGCKTLGKKPLRSAGPT